MSLDGSAWQVVRRKVPQRQPLRLHYLDIGHLEEALNIPSKVNIARHVLSQVLLSLEQ